MSSVRLTELLPAWGLLSLRVVSQRYLCLHKQVYRYKCFIATSTPSASSNPAIYTLTKQLHPIKVYLKTLQHTEVRASGRELPRAFTTYLLYHSLPNTSGTTYHTGLPLAGWGEA